MAARKAKPKFVTPPTTLQAKVKVGGPGAVDAAALARAEQVIAGMAGDYLEWAEDDLVDLEEVLEKLRAAEQNDRGALIERVFRISHDIKGQGGSFGYDMMTRIGGRLCDFVENLEKAGAKEIGAKEIGAKEIQVIQLHFDAMKLVIVNRMAGDGGEGAQKLFDDLKKVTDKVTAG